ncbi:MAG: hypothetical protein R2752_23355 [Vicinamibacterales bacterium]
MVWSRFVAAGLAAVSWSCAGTSGLDSRIPVDTPGQSVRYSTPRIVLDLDGSIDVFSLSRPTGARVTTGSELRRLLVRLPVSDWPNGRHILVLPPSVGVSLEEADRLLRTVLPTLSDLGIDVQIISQPSYDPHPTAAGTGSMGGRG